MIEFLNQHCGRAAPAVHSYILERERQLKATHISTTALRGHFLDFAKFRDLTANPAYIVLADFVDHIEKIVGLSPGYASMDAVRHNVVMGAMLRDLQDQPLTAVDQAVIETTNELDEDSPLTVSDFSRCIDRAITKVKL